MGLLIAFTFSGAASRFEARRSLIVQETNDIGTAYLRIDMLPADAQPALRQDFRDYLDARLEFYDAIGHNQSLPAQVGLRKGTAYNKRSGPRQSPPPPGRVRLQLPRWFSVR